MATQRSVVINGDLGSGKSTVSRLLADRLGIRRISVGDLYREMARQRDMTALQLNLHAELDDKIDHYVDQLQADIAMSGEPLVVDSRLAWHFFHDALKVHLVTDPTVAAQRVMGRPADDVERYASIDEALLRLAERGESERTRFIQRYGVDKERLRNYDVVCDSTRATPEEIVARISEAMSDPRPGPRLFVDPRRIRLADGPGVDDGPVQLGYSVPHFFAVSGRGAIGTAVRAGQPLVAADLAEDTVGPRAIAEPDDGRRVPLIS